jgi:hypothetical protein
MIRHVPFLKHRRTSILNIEQGMMNDELKKLVFLGILLLSLVISCQTPDQREAGSVSEANFVESTTNDAGFVSLFDGETLEGWQGDTTLWRAEDARLIGEILPGNALSANSFLIWQGGQPADFELKTEFRITENGNSGINYRSERIDTIPYALRGYQADIDGKNTYTGQNYEERKRTTLAYRGEQATIESQPNPAAPGSLRANVKNNAWNSRETTASLGQSDSLKALIKGEDWNECHLVLRGNRLQHYINGVLMSEVIDQDTVNRKMAGLLGVQVHVGPPMRVEYRNIRLKEL